MTKHALGAAYSAMSGIQGVGRGIGSIFILFVIFYYISALLDGSKFQTKMLAPLLIYLLVCNFQLVAVPVVNFAVAIQSSCVSQCRAQRSAALSAAAGGKEVNSVMEAFMAKKESELTEAEKKLMEIDNEGDVTFKENSGGADGDGEGSVKVASKGWFATMSSNLLMSMKKAAKWIWTTLFVKPFFTTQQGVHDLFTWGLPGLIALILSWVCEVVSWGVSALGAVMTGIVVAFGPITWAFAIVPGNSKTISAWAIRICQFALYAPIAALIDAFSCTFMLDFANGLSAGGSILGILCVMVANTVCLTCVPTIASMIIEGASGSVSLSGGLQTVGHAMGTMVGIATAPVRGAFGAGQWYNKIKAGTVMGGESKRDKAQAATLSQIAGSLKNIEGQNNNR